MSWVARLRFTAGVILVIGLVGALTVVFNQRISQATSTTASILAESYPVGTTSGGVVTHQYVQVGGSVQKGQRLFDVQNPQPLLTQTGQSGASAAPAPQDADAQTPTQTDYSITRGSVTTLLATVTGRLAAVNVPQGGFAQSGSVLASIDGSGSLYVSAEFRLTGRDYARIPRDARVDVYLPDGKVLHGHLDSIVVSTQDGQARTTAKVECAGLVEGTDNGIVNPGTPVTASVHLQHDGIFAGVSDALGDFARSIGLP